MSIVKHGHSRPKAKSVGYGVPQSGLQSVVAF